MKISKKRLKTLQLLPEYLLFLFASHSYENNTNSNSYIFLISYSMISLTAEILLLYHCLVSTLMSQTISKITHIIVVFRLLIYKKLLSHLHSTRMRIYPAS